jgi:hypothetical protein
MFMMSQFFRPASSKVSRVKVLVLDLDVLLAKGKDGVVRLAGNDGSITRDQLACLAKGGVKIYLKNESDERIADWGPRQENINDEEFVSRCGLPIESSRIISVERLLGQKSVTAAAKNPTQVLMQAVVRMTKCKPNQLVYIGNRSIQSTRGWSFTVHRAGSSTDLTRLLGELLKRNGLNLTRGVPRASAASAPVVGVAASAGPSTALLSVLGRGGNRNYGGLGGGSAPERPTGWRQ